MLVPTTVTFCKSACASAVNIAHFTHDSRCMHMLHMHLQQVRYHGACAIINEPACTTCGQDNKVCLGKDMPGTGKCTVNLFYASDKYTA